MGRLVSAPGEVAEAPFLSDVKSCAGAREHRARRGGRGFRADRDGDQAPQRGARHRLVRAARYMRHYFMAQGIAIEEW